MKKFFLIDFDGTIVDLWPRYCAVFNDILGLTVPLKDYKAVKQKLLRDSDVARYFSATLPIDYFETKAHKLEECSYLELDQLLLPCTVINDLQNLIVLTKRRNSTNFFWQFKKLKLNCDAIIVNSGNKRDWVRNFCPFDQAIIIGDSVVDLEIAELDGFDAYMVGYGLGTKVQFDSLGINYKYLEKPSDVLETLKQMEMFE